MKILLFLPIFSTFLMSNFVLAKEEQCAVIALKEGSEVIDMHFEIPKKNQQIKLLFMLSDQEKTKIHDLFYCIFKEKNIECSGDDDGGRFTLYPDEKSLSITRIGSGNPDQKRIELKPIPKTLFKLIDCSLLRKPLKE